MAANKTKKPTKPASPKRPVAAQTKAKAQALADVPLRQSGLCAQAQADGVPCAELGRRCEECDKADAKFAR